MKKEIPVQVDDIVDVEITATGSKGDGIAKIEGFSIIIPETKIGERLTIQVTKV